MGGFVLVVVWALALSSVGAEFAQVNASAQGRCDKDKCGVERDVVDLMQVHANVMSKHTDERTEAADARFLMRASFGPTRESLAAMRGTTYEAWVQEQMALPAGSHRAFLRRHANPRPLGRERELRFGGPREKCDKGSRWIGFALSAADVGRKVSTAGGKVQVDGALRTQIDAEGNRLPAAGTCSDEKPASWRRNTCKTVKDWSWRCKEWQEQTSGEQPCRQSCFDAGYGYEGDDCSSGWGSANIQAYVCEVVEAVGGLVKMSSSPACPKNKLQYMLNPAIWLSGAKAAAAATSLEFSLMRPGIIHLEHPTASCELGDFIQSDTEGESFFYRFDPRMELLRNEPSSPTAEKQYAEAACPVAPKTFLNERDCKVGKGCGLGRVSLVCGSPNEVANDPKAGHLLPFCTSETKSDQKNVQKEDLDPKIWSDPATDDGHTSATKKNMAKASVWFQMALYAEDQLRQRIAWALAQIFVVGTDEAEIREFNEKFVHFNDIFVRNAFGSYRDVMREVTYSSIMGRYLTYRRNRAFDSGNHFPDENYAREIMQLFTIGLWQLNADGTRMKDERGEDIPTYSNEHIMNFARVFTGFDERPGRANIEASVHNFNTIDPMMIRPNLHDVYPKPDLEGNFLGDGYPLCSDMPPSQFLAKGAKYEFVGTEGERPNALVLGEKSPLFEALCRRSGGMCSFAPSVTLPKTLACHGEECEVDLPRTLQVSDGFFRYVPPTCVHLFFFNGRTVRTPRWWGSSSSTATKCLDPASWGAETSCCAGCTDVRNNWMKNKGLTCENAEEKWPGNKDKNGGFPKKCKAFEKQKSKFCMLSCWKLGFYKDEDCSFGLRREERRCLSGKVRLASAEATCAKEGLSVCATRTSKKCGEDRELVWTDAPCTVTVEVHADGKVSSLEDSVTKQNKFAVKWRDGEFPAQASGSCPGHCVPSGGGCACSIRVENRPAFEKVPASAAAARSKLFIGSPRPAGSCSAGCEGRVRAFTTDGRIGSEDTVIEIDGQFFKNVESLVHVADFSFRNPQAFMERRSPRERDAEAEVESLLDHLFRHRNTPTFVAYRLIQRLVSSNPSGAYVRAASEAFSSGSYGGKTYSGAYGDLGATVAAVLLHPEAHSPSSDTDGKLREPLVKLMHLMRAMEYKDESGGVVKMKDLMSLVGQSPYRPPSVFNFYLPEFEPDDLPEGLVAPEFQIFTPPWAIGFVNGAASLIRNGLGACDQGFGWANTLQGCAAGRLTFEARGTAEQMLDELDLLLTGGRLGGKKELVRKAMAAAQEGDKLKAAQEAIVMMPEFNILGSPGTTSSRAPSPGRWKPEPRSYKAAVLLFMEGGADTFNMLVPLGCALQKEYAEVRKGVALQASELLKISTKRQKCERFGVHGQFKFLHKLYNRGKAAFVSNVGNLVEPLTGLQFKKGGGKKCNGLFSHSDMQNSAQTLKCQIPGTSPKGAGGRMADVLASGKNAYQSSSFSVSGIKTWPTGVDTRAEVIDRKNGVVELSRKQELRPMLNEITAVKHSNVYFEGYAKGLAHALDTSEELGAILDAAKLKTKFQTTFEAGDNRLAMQLRQVARLIAARDARKAERDFFFVSLGGFDTHAAVAETLTTNFKLIDDALSHFVAELEAQKVFDDVVLVTHSDFGRTLSPNGGEGTDHAWAGQHVLLGGAVAGGEVYNEYPASLLPGNEQDAGRGRLVPKYPWETVMVPIAEWMGVEQSQFPYVFPNLDNFDRSEHIIESSTLFKK